MRLITFATHEIKYFRALRINAERHGFEWVRLGEHHVFRCLRDKLEAYHAYLSTFENTPDEIVCLIDAFDCIVLASPDELLDKYNDIRHNTSTPPIVFSATVNEWAPARLTEAYGPIRPEDADKPYNRLNSGMCIGPIGRLVTLFAHALATYSFHDDQTILTHCYYHEGDRFGMVLDSTGAMFYNIEKDPWYWWRMGSIPIDRSDAWGWRSAGGTIPPRLYLVRTGTTPVIVQSISNQNMDAWASFLHLPLQERTWRHSIAYWMYSSLFSWNTRRFA